MRILKEKNDDEIKPKQIIHIENFPCRQVSEKDTAFLEKVKDLRMLFLAMAYLAETLC
jgi:hypothetical protein